MIPIHSLPQFQFPHTRVTPREMVETDMSLVPIACFPSLTVGLLVEIVSLVVTVPVNGVTLLMGQRTEVRGLNEMYHHVDTVSISITINVYRACLSVRLSEYVCCNL